MAKHKSLGRGLDALLASAELSDDRLTTLAIDSVRPGRFQPRSRMDDKALDELAASIRAQGIIQPLVVREIGLGDYELIAGERRWRAAYRAGLHEVPAVVKSVPDEDALVMALIENIQRQELGPIEEAEGLKRLVDEFGLTHEEVADAVGRSRSAVSNLMRLLNLPDTVREMLLDGQLEMGHGRALLALPVVDQLALAKEAYERGWSVREVERRVQKCLQGGGTTPVRRQEDPDILALAERVSERVGAKVHIRHNAKGRGKVMIEYASLEQLEQLLARL